MIFDKEYPATHSMSTAWYMVDTDGNVGIMEFDDNGPVPIGVAEEAYDRARDMVFGQGFTADGKAGGIHLSENQVLELLGQPVSQDDVESWCDVCLAVNSNCVKDFLELCQNKDITNYGCILSEMNLYYIDACDCTDDNFNIIKDSTLDRMLRSNMIQDIYNAPQLEMDSEYDRNTDSVVFTKDFDNAPYYIYRQSYWTGYPQHRMNVPKHPVKLSQIDKMYHDRLLHLPIRFSDTEDMQIAQWFASKSHDKVIEIDDAGYTLLPIDKDTQKYCLARPFLHDFYEYCPDMGYYKCSKCNHDCLSMVSQVRSLSPTVLYIVPPTQERIDISQLLIPGEIKDKLIIFSYIPKFPHKEGIYWASDDKLKELMATENLIPVFAYSRGWFEHMVRIINPRAIIIDDKALEVFTSVFPIANDTVCVNDAVYPIFKLSSAKQHEDSLTALAHAPYRGKTFPQTYAEEEVEELKRQGRISDYDN